MKFLEKRNYFSDKTKIKKFILLVFVMLGILLWQFKFFSTSNVLSNSFTRTDASGLRFNSSKQFLYFYYYLNLYPVVPSVAPTNFSKEGARDFLNDHGKETYMDRDFMVMWGDNVKNIMFFPNAILSGSAENPSVKVFNTILFIVALFSILVSFCYVNKFILGAILAVLLGSNPFQLYEVYGNENLFSVHISVLMILLSINLPLLLLMKRPRYYNEFAIIASGIIIGTLAHIRVESLALIASCLMVYLFTPEMAIKKKLLNIIIFIVIFYLTNQSWVKYFDYKYKEASKVVESVGGNLSPYAGLRQSHHTIWHSIFAGFSDFDQKYGFKWDDQAAYNYAMPILVAGGVELPKEKEVWSVIPEYQQVIKEKVINQIKDDPKWYFDIIYKRTNFLFEKTVPVSININNHSAGFNISKVYLISLIAVLIIFLIFSKEYFLLKLLLFSFPPSFVIIGIYSQKNITSISVFQIFTLAIYCYLILPIIYKIVQLVYNKQSLASLFYPLINQRKSQ